jgi:hypothetical protein
MPNSLRPGKEHGISRFLGAFRIAQSCAGIPCPGEQGIFVQEQGILSPNRAENREFAA